MSRRLRLTVLVVALLAAFAPAARASSSPPGARVGFWASQNFVPCGAQDPAFCPRDLSSYTPAVWDVLASTGGALYLDMVYTSDFGPTPSGVAPRTDGLELIRHANQLGVPVNAWITLPLADGTFANENNASVVGDAVREFHDWAIAQDVKIGEVALDMEFPLGYQPVADLLSADPARQRALLSTGIDPAHQCVAMRSYRATIEWAHAHGMRLTSTPISFAIDDLADGHMALQDALDVAPGPDPGFDAMYVQAYRSYSNPSPAYAASYFASMRTLFGTRGEASLGGIGQPPYDNLANVVFDIRMLAGLGARTIPLFDLDGTVRTFGADGLRSIIEAGRNPLGGTELAASTIETPYDKLNRQFFRQLDAVASSLTPLVTIARGGIRQPNAFPSGCSG